MLELVQGRGPAARAGEPSLIAGITRQVMARLPGRPAARLCRRALGRRGGRRDHGRDLSRPLRRGRRALGLAAGAAATCPPPSPPCRAGRRAPPSRPARRRLGGRGGSCRRSCSMATRTGRSIRATATGHRPGPRRRRRRPAGDGDVAAGSGPRRAGLPPHAPRRRGRSGDPRALGDPGRRPCLGGRQPRRLLHRPARARCVAGDAPLLPRAPASRGGGAPRSTSLDGSLANGAKREADGKWPAGLTRPGVASRRRAARSSGRPHPRWCWPWLLSRQLTDTLSRPR